MILGLSWLCVLNLSVLSGVGVNWFVVFGRVDRGTCYSFSAKSSAHSARQYDWVLASQSVLYRHLLCYLLHPFAM